MIHETCHSLVDAVANLPLGEGEGGSLNEGFADFFTAVYTNNPRLGEVAYLKGPFKRTVANNLKLSDKNGGLYHDSQILSGTLWDVEQALGAQKSLNLAMKILSRLGPSGDFSKVPDAVHQALTAGFADEDQKIVSEILAKRGW